MSRKSLDEKHFFSKKRNIIGECKFIPCMGKLVYIEPVQCGSKFSTRHSQCWKQSSIFKKYVRNSPKLYRHLIFTKADLHRHLSEGINLKVLVKLPFFKFQRSNCWVVYFKPPKNPCCVELLSYLFLLHTQLMCHRYMSTAVYIRYTSSILMKFTGTYMSVVLSAVHIRCFLLSCDRNRE